MAEQPPGKRGPANPPTSKTTINDLPDDLRIRILTFLPLISAVETSFISRKWRNLWRSVPSLNFNINQYRINPAYPNSLNIQRFADFVSRTLLHRPNNLPLHAFSLLFRYSSNHRHRALVTSWLRYALDCRVVELNVNFGAFPAVPAADGGPVHSPLYGFHFSDLSDNASVRCLILCRCEIIMPLNTLVRFQSLRRLELFNVGVADNVLSDLISRCDNLEGLVLSRFWGLRRFRIVSQKLRDLELRSYLFQNEEGLNSSLEISAPNLSRLKVYQFYVANYTGDLSSVLEAELDFFSIEGSTCESWDKLMSLLTGVERLTAQNNFDGFMKSKLESNESVEFKNLKHLELKTGYTHFEMKGLAELLRRSPILETLVLDSCFYQTDLEARFYDHYKAMPYKFDIPSLQEIKMTNFRSTDNEKYVLCLLGRETVVLNKVVLVPAKLNEASQTGLIVLDLTACEDGFSVFAALARCHLVPSFLMPKKVELEL